MAKHTVQIRKMKTDEVVKEIECANEMAAMRVEMGVQINLNHEEYYTCVTIEPPYQHGPDVPPGGSKE